MPDGEEGNPEDRTISALLADLADDPEAPPSSVTLESVLAAARAAEASGTDLPTDGGRRLRVVGKERSAGPSRRRTGLIALVAAASVAAVAAVVIPLSLNAGSTTTSADGAQEAASASASAGAAAMEAAPAPPAADLSAPAAGPDRAGSAAGSAAAAGTAESQADAGVLASAAASCWPALTPSAAAALTAALPSGAFGEPQPLLQECGADPVAGAMLPGARPGTELVVRVSKAEVGACARASGEAVSRCIAAGDGQPGDGRYVGTDSAGSTTAFAYGGGYEVAVGGPTPSAGVPASPTGLTTAQLQSAAGALLEAVQ